MRPLPLCLAGSPWVGLFSLPPTVRCGLASQQARGQDDTAPPFFFLSLESPGTPASPPPPPSRFTWAVLSPFSGFRPSDLRKACAQFPFLPNTGDLVPVAFPPPASTAAPPFFPLFDGTYVFSVVAFGGGAPSPPFFLGDIRARVPFFFPPLPPHTQVAELLAFFFSPHCFFKLGFFHPRRTSSLPLFF